MWPYLVAGLDFGVWTGILPHIYGFVFLDICVFGFGLGDRVCGPMMVDLV
jgi:hypothetical protein